MSDKLKQLMSQIAVVELVANADVIAGDPRSRPSREMARNAASAQLSVLKEEYGKELLANTTAVFLNPGKWNYNKIDSFKDKLSSKLSKASTGSKSLIVDLSSRFVELAKELSPQIGKDNTLTSHHLFVISNYISDWGVVLGFDTLAVPQLPSGTAVRGPDELVNLVRQSVRYGNGDLLQFTEAERDIVKMAVKNRVDSKLYVFFVGASNEEYVSASKKFFTNKVIVMEFEEEPSKAELKHLLSE